MYTNQPIKIHTKCLLILEMMQKSNNYIQEAISRLYTYDNTKDWTHPVRLMNTREEIESSIVRLKKVNERIVQYYHNTLSQLPEVKYLRNQIFEIIKDRDKDEVIEPNY